MSKQAIRMIKEHEGLRLQPYLDTVGKMTVGYGHNLDDRGISLAVAELMLKEDYEEAEKQAQNLVWFDELTNVRQDVVIMMIFNL